MWDERYSDEEYAYGKDANDFLVENTHQLKKATVLCLADGEGRNSVFLAEQGYDATSVDASAEGIKKAIKLAQERNVNIQAIVADLNHYSIEENSWDSIVSIFCHLPPDLRKQVHADVVKGLKPGGVLLLEAYTPDQIILGTGGPPVAEMTMTLSQLQEELKGLVFEVAHEKNRNVVEGKYHTGEAAVVQIVARKPG